MKVALEYGENNLGPHLTINFLYSSVGKASACSMGDLGSVPGLTIPWRRKWQHTPVFLPGESLYPRRDEPGRLQFMGSQESDIT